MFCDLNRVGAPGNEVIYISHHFALSPLQQLQIPIFQQHQHFRRIFIWRLICLGSTKFKWTFAAGGVGAFQMPRVIMWGLSLYCCVNHRCCTAEQRLMTLGNQSCSPVQMGHPAKRGCTLAREGCAALLNQGAACFTSGGSCANPPEHGCSHFCQRRCSDCSTYCQNAHEDGANLTICLESQ